MIEAPKRYKFTAEEIMQQTGVKPATVRSQISRLRDKGLIKIVDRLRPHNVNIYESYIEPLTLLGYGEPPPPPGYVPPTTYFNNLFGDEVIPDQLRELWLQKAYGGVQ